MAFARGAASVLVALVRHVGLGKCVVRGVRAGCRCRSRRPAIPTLFVPQLLADPSRVLAAILVRLRVGILPAAFLCHSVSAPVMR